MTATRMSDPAGPHATGDRRDASRSDRNAEGARYSDVVQILHECIEVMATNGRLAWAMLLCLVGGHVAVTGCGPITADRPEARPPYIDPDSASPNRRVITVTDEDPDNVEFSATALDPNREDLLNSVWTTESELLADRELARGDTVELNGEQFYEFDPVTFEIDPCQVAEGGEKQTIWLYIADRRFQNVSPIQNEIRVRPGGYVVSRSWVLSLGPSACSGSL